MFILPTLKTPDVNKQDQTVILKQA